MAPLGLVLVAVVATCTLVAGQESTTRPSMQEWQDGQAAAAAEKHAAVDKQKKMSAVDKVVELLEALQKKVLEEGEAEAKAYDSFACFCKDTTKEKVEAIEKGEDSKEALTATTNDLTAKRLSHDANIQNAQENIAAHQKERQARDEERAATRKVYDSNNADLKAALEALEGAIATLKGSKAPSFAEISSISKTLNSATTLAEALGLASPEVSRAAAVLLQQAPANEVQMQDYDFHSDGIITTLEKLNDDFRSTKVQVDEDEVASVKAHDLFVEANTHAIKMETERLEKEKKARADAIADIETTSQELAVVEATLLEDKEYTNKLAKMCADKAKTWDQRSHLRALELQTLTQAMGIIKGAISEKTTAATVRFVQRRMSVRFAKAVADDDTAMRAIEGAAEEADAAGVSFVQLSQPWRPSARGAAFLATARRHVSQEMHMGNEHDAKAAIVQLLKAKGHELKSTLLVSLATKVAADPFAKVKVLIQELIERLLTEAANEANHKGWCDKATSDANQKRDCAAEEIATLNNEMAKLEARRDMLDEKLSELGTAIDELVAARDEAVTKRKEEKAQNENTISEAQAGLEALTMCQDILKQFYANATKQTVALSLAQADPSADAPDAGFDNGEAYTGAQAEAGGILGMLDVMKSDFTRTIEETQKAEQQAEKDHLEFMTETGKDLAQKQEAHDQFSEQLVDTKNKLSEADQNLSDETDRLNTAVSELLELKPVCVDTGMSYEERVGLREEEIAALNKALCVLEKYTEYGPDGAADGC